MAGHIPDGYNSVSAYLIFKDVPRAMDFYAQAFGAQTDTVIRSPDGSIMHADMRIGNSSIMLSQENPQWNAVSAETLGDCPISLHLYVEDCVSLIEDY